MSQEKENAVELETEVGNVESEINENEIDFSKYYFTRESTTKVKS